MPQFDPNSGSGFLQHNEQFTFLRATLFPAQTRENLHRGGCDSERSPCRPGSHDEEHPFELPGRLFEQLPFAVYVCDRDGLVLRYNRRAAELWGRSPKLGDPNERFCGSYRMFRPTGVCCRTTNAPWRMCCAPVFPCANRKYTSSGLTACAASRSLTSRRSGIAMETLSAPSTASRI